MILCQPRFDLWQEYTFRQSLTTSKKWFFLHNNNIPLKAIKYLSNCETSLLEPVSGTIAVAGDSEMSAEWDSASPPYASQKYCHAESLQRPGSCYACQTPLTDYTACKWLILPIISVWCSYVYSHVKGGTELQRCKISYLVADLRSESEIQSLCLGSHATQLPCVALF